MRQHAGSERRKEKDHHLSCNEDFAMPPNQISFENLYITPFTKKIFLTQKISETQMKISLMRSIHRTSNVLIFFHKRLKVRKNILKLSMQSM